MVKIGNAPVSYGAFEVTVGIAGAPAGRPPGTARIDGVPGPAEVLDGVQAAGYAGIDLGPLGYLGLDGELASALGSRGLLLTGGYVEIDVTDERSAAAGLAQLGGVCDQFDAVTGQVDTVTGQFDAGSAGVERQFLPRPTVALTGSPEAASRWERIERAVDEVVGLCRDRGYEACLHNEVGTQLSAPDSVTGVLERTEAALCLDIGHLVAAGGDPLAILAKFWHRVRHVHLKDVRPSPSGRPFTEAMQIWQAGAFCRLGDGHARVDAVLDALRAGGYEGWIVVEQDLLPRGPRSFVQASADQRRNRQYLRERGW